MLEASLGLVLTLFAPFRLIDKNLTPITVLAIPTYIIGPVIVSVIGALILAEISREGAKPLSSQNART